MSTPPSELKQLQRQYSEMAERLATLEVAYLGLVDVTERVTSLLETLFRGTRERNQIQGPREQDPSPSEPSGRPT